MIREYQHTCTYCKSEIMMVDEIHPLIYSERIQKKVRAISCPICLDFIGYKWAPRGYFMPRMELRVKANKHFHKSPRKTYSVAEE